jgi:hypothetical protein
VASCQGEIYSFRAVVDALNANQTLEKVIIAIWRNPSSGGLLKKVKKMGEFSEGAGEQSYHPLRQERDSKPTGERKEKRRCPQGGGFHGGRHAGRQGKCFPTAMGNKITHHSKSFLFLIFWTP